MVLTEPHPDSDSAVAGEGREWIRRERERSQRTASTLRRKHDHPQDGAGDQAEPS